MIVFHGTTRRSARKIACDGFRPQTPSRQVWFSRSKGYATQRSYKKARRGNDRPIVLAVELDLEGLKRRYGSEQVRHHGGVICIKCEIPPTMLRAHYGLGIPDSPEDITRWLNTILNVKPHKGVSVRHPGVQRLALWVDNKLSANPSAHVTPKQMLSYAMQWIPEHFARVEVDFNLMRSWPRSVRTDEGPKESEGEYIPPPPEDHRAEEAQECLASGKPLRLVRGLRLLAVLHDVDLFEWCALALGECDLKTQIDVLKVMRRCEDIDPEVVALYAESEHKAVRAAALEVLCLHGGDGAHEWFWKGLTDPEPHVRLSTVRFLDRLDAKVHRDIFETALYDPHPQVAQVARKLVKGMGYTKIKW